jgi:hypothetical protein
MGQKGRWVLKSSQVWIWMKLRRKAMQRITNKKGHWRRRLRQLVKFTKEALKFRNQRGDFVEDFKMNLYKEIYVLHLKETSSLYQGATSLILLLASIPK